MSSVPAVVGSRLGDIGRTIVTAPFSAGGGIIEGFRDYRAAVTSTSHALPKWIANPEIVRDAASGSIVSISSTVCNWLKNLFRNVTSTGFTKINFSGFFGALKNAALFQPGALGVLGKSVGALGLLGGPLLIGGLILGGMAAFNGILLAYRSHNMIDRDLLGKSLHDFTNDPKIHTAQMISGLLAPIGFALCFIPGGQIPGAAAIACGWVGAKATELYKHFACEANWFTLPDSAPLWWRAIFGRNTFNNYGTGHYT